MPRIPTLGFQTRPAGPVQQPRASAEAIGATATGARQLGRGISESAQTLHEINEKQAAFEAELQAVETENVARERLNQLKQEAPEGAEGFTDRVSEEFDNWLPELMDKAPDSNRARKVLQARYAGLKSKLISDAQRFQAESKTALDLRRFGEAQTGLMNQARAYPERMDDLLRQAGDLTAGAPFPDEQLRAKYGAGMRLGVINSTLDGWVTKFETEATDAESVTAAISALKSGAFGFRDEASSNVYDQALTRLQNRHKSLDVESRASFGKDLADELVTIQNHGRTTGKVTKERAMRVYKDDPDMANRVMQQMDSEMRMFNLRQQMSFTTLADDRAVLAEQFSRTAGTGAAFEDQNFREHVQAVQNKWKEYQTDKVAYLMKHDASIADQWRKANAEDDAEARDRVLSLMDKKQEAMGTPYWEREFLGRGAAQQVALRLQGMGAEDAANEIESIQRQYKVHLPQVLRELESAKIDPIYMVIGRLDGVNDVGLRKQLAGYAQVGLSTLRKNAGELNAADADAAIANMMPEFAKTLYYAPRQGQEIVNREREAIRILTYGLMQKGAYTPKEAATEAFNQVLGNKYDFGQTYRAPKGELGLVERSANTVLINARGTPEIFPMAAPGRDMRPEIWESEEGKKFRRDAYMRNAIENGVWVNSPDGSGLMRMAPDDMNVGQYSPVKLADGSNWIITFAEMRQNPPVADPLQSGEVWVLP